MTLTRNRPVVLLSLGHACVDVYQGTVAALVPYFVAERAYGYAAASGVVLAASLLSSLVQPLFGALTDRWALPWLLPLSTLTAGAGVALGGLAGSYPLTLAAVAAGGAGVAAYHPEAARAAREAARGSHTAMGWFSLGGNVGFALAPPLVWAVVGGGGLGASWLLVLPAVAGAVLCAAAVRSAGAVRAAGGRTALPEATDDWPSFLRLTGAVVCRSVVFVGLSTFVSLYVRERVGGGGAAGTAALFVLYLGGAVGTVAGGRLADRYGRLKVVRRSYVLTVLAVAGVVLVPGPAVYLCVALTSAGLYVPFSLHITLGQDYLPRRVGTASGVTLGLAVSVGGLAAPALGALADATSLREALLPLVALPAVGRLLLCGLREPAVPPAPPAVVSPPAPDADVR
ncbi:MFS transporter [Streptomyces sp. enrichment culture]|uniref:MFS transporter n=1 Tax=Streptomyces sp. enrichment culture TaxID=1795815 RepID=UPI003F56A095